MRCQPFNSLWWTIYVINSVDNSKQSCDVSLENLVLDKPVIPLLIFSLFSSLVCLILYWHCKEKFCLDHSWELKCEGKKDVFCLVRSIIRKFLSSHKELNFRTPAWTQMSEVQFLMGYQNVFLGPMLMARNKKSSSFFATMLKIYQLFYSNYHNITPKNLALNHNTWLVIFFLLLVTFLLENVLIWWGEISFWSLLGVTRLLMLWVCLLPVPQWCCCQSWLSLQQELFKPQRWSRLHNPTRC